MFFGGRKSGDGGAQETQLLAETNHEPHPGTELSYLSDHPSRDKEVGRWQGEGGTPDGTPGHQRATAAHDGRTEEKHLC